MKYTFTHRLISMGVSTPGSRIPKREDFREASERIKGVAIHTRALLYQHFQAKNQPLNNFRDLMGVESVTFL